MLLKTYVDSHTKLQKIRKQPRNHYNYEAVKMILNILLLSLLICVTSVSPNSSSAISKCSDVLKITLFSGRGITNPQVRLYPLASANLKCSDSNGSDKY